MKRQKLLENDSIPDFISATGITLFIIAFSLIVSLLTIKIFSIFPDTLLMNLWELFSSTILTGLLLWNIFTRYRNYIIKFLRYPSFEYFSKGLYYYMLFIPVLFSVTTIFLYLCKIAGLNPMPQEVISIYLNTNSFYILFILSFLSCIVAPFAEEVIFRGIIYNGFKTRFSIRLSMILSSLIFALLHNEIFVLPGLFVFGIFLSYLFEKYQNLWLSISVHFLNNFFTTIVILMIKYFYHLPI